MLEANLKKDLLIYEPFLGHARSHAKFGPDQLSCLTNKETPRQTSKIYMYRSTEMEFKEFEPRFKSAKTRFKLSAGLNLETFDTILSGTNHI